MELADIGMAGGPKKVSLRILLKERYKQMTFVL